MLAEVRRVRFEQIAAETTTNFAELFAKTGLAG
jgi:Tat protein secretion system quality control protein TatD with DNase activity